jgi:hypothetical protein
MKEAKGKLVRGPNSQTGVLYIPSNLMVDSAFPFKVPTELKVTIDGDKLIITKA